MSESKHFLWGLALSVAMSSGALAGTSAEGPRPAPRQGACALGAHQGPATAPWFLLLALAALYRRRQDLVEELAACSAAVHSRR